MTAQLITEVLSLPVAERLHLVEEIWDSLPSDSDTAASLALSPEEAAELAQRSQAHIADPASSLDWETAQRRIQDLFGLRL